VARLSDRSNGCAAVELNTTNSERSLNGVLSPGSAIQKWPKIPTDSYCSRIAFTGSEWITRYSEVAITALSRSPNLVHDGSALTPAIRISSNAVSWELQARHFYETTARHSDIRQLRGTFTRPRATYYPLVQGWLATMPIIGEATRWILRILVL
jgi:hypothetical protein